MASIMPTHCQAGDTSCVSLGALADPQQQLLLIYKPLPPLPAVPAARAPCSLPVELAEMVVESLEDPDYQELWRDWRLISQTFKAGVESVFARIYLNRMSIRIVLDHPPKHLYFRLWEYSQDGQHAVFRDCRYRPLSSDQTGSPFWGLALAHWQRTTMRGWKKRWRATVPRRPFNMAVVELGKQQKFMELPALLVSLEGIHFQLDWRRLLSSFFRGPSRAIMQETRRAATSCYFPGEWNDRAKEKRPSAFSLVELQRSSVGT